MARRRLENCSDVKKYLSYLIRQTQAKKIDGGLATKLGYLINILLRAIESSDIESRLTELEKKVTQGDTTNGYSKRTGKAGTAI